MSFHVPHPHPIRRATASIHGHHLHIARDPDRLGYVARCSCGFWAKFRFSRRQAVRAFHAHLATIGLGAGAPKHLRRAA